MKLSVVRPDTPYFVNGRPYQVTAIDYVRVDAIDLRGTWKVQDSVRFTRTGFKH